MTFEGVNDTRVYMYSAALIIAVSLMLHSFIQKRTDKRQNVTFLYMVGALIINSSTEIVCEFLHPHISDSAAAFNVYKVFQLLYFVVHVLLAPLFLLYEMSVTDLIKKLKNYTVVFVVSIVFATEILVLTNPITNFVYYYDGYDFTRNWGEGIIYIVAVVFLLLSLVNLFYYWRAINPIKKMSLLYFFGVVILGLLIQLLFPEVRCELFAEAIAFMGVMITIENDDIMKDYETGVYDRPALMTELKNNEAMNVSFGLISLRLKDVDTVFKTNGPENFNKLSVEVAEFLKTLIQRYYIYHFERGHFVIIVNTEMNDQGRQIVRKLARKYESKYNLSELAKKIDERFKDEWIIDDTRYLLGIAQVKMSYPDEVTDVNDIIYLLNTDLPEGKEKSIYEGEDLKKMLRKTEVKKAITRGLEESEFEVYYQPIYHIDGEKLYGAEALLRLHDRQLGEIYPDEFIPAVEEMGLIDALDDYVLKNVCAFIKSGIPAGGAMKSISVNLSLLQFSNEDFVERLNSIVEVYKIPKTMVNFEITETVGSDDMDDIKDMVSRLKNFGFHFSMDDYGTGYSNISKSFSLDFDVVKIDKSILWGAEKSELGMTVLTNTIYMIKQLNKKIVVEGVETKEQMELLRKLDVDYLQGYYFSKPITKDEFIHDIIGIKEL